MSFFEVFKAELKTIFTDKALVLTIIGGVVLYAFLYPQPYLKESVRAFKVAVVDLDRSDVSRKISFMIDSTAAIEVDGSYMSVKAAQEGIKRGEVRGLVLLPKHLKRDLYLQKQPAIAIGADASYFLIYGSVAKAAAHAVLSESSKIKVIKMLLEEEGIAKAKQDLAAFDIKEIALYNPNGSYLLYVIPAVFILILQQTMLIGLGILGGGYREKVYARDENESAVWKNMLARTLIFMTLYFIHILFYFGFVFEFFGIYHIGKIGDILTFSFAFLLSSSALGLFLGALFKSREIATPVVLLSSLPIVFSAGFIWPLESIPEWIVSLSYITPVSFAIKGFLSINQFGSGIADVIDLFTALLLQASLYFILAFVILRDKQLKKIR